MLLGQLGVAFGLDWVSKLSSSMGGLVLPMRVPILKQTKPRDILDMFSRINRA